MPDAEERPARGSVAGAGLPLKICHHRQIRCLVDHLRYCSLASAWPIEERTPVTQPMLLFSKGKQLQVDTDITKKSLCVRNYVKAYLFYV